MERASKIAHAEIINHPGVQNYISRCALPSAPEPVSLEGVLTKLASPDLSEVRAVIAIDGGFTETYIRDEYPSACVAFFTFGPLLFELEDLRALDKKQFIAPEDLARLKNIERYVLVLPTKGVRFSDEPSLASTIRCTIFEFFSEHRGTENEDHLLASLRWFLFRSWRKKPGEASTVEIEWCPSGCGFGPVVFVQADSSVKACPGCGRDVFITDVFRLHERVDEELGAGGIISYVGTMLEQLVLVHVLYGILEHTKPSLLRSLLFIKDGPLAFFGVVAPLHKPMRDLVGHLLSTSQSAAGPTLRLAGVEKSGAFVEHAAAVQDRMPKGSYFLAGNQYIRKYIVPGDATASYGENTYYGQKVFFRAPTGEVHVVTVPARSYLDEPRPEDIPHLEETLTLIAELRCSMYDNALIPVALANKLVSLSDFPSQRLLTLFARKAVDKR